MNNKIDIVIPFLNPESESWRKEFETYKNEYGLKSENRFRDWGTMKYVLRGIETNCPWINKVHIILFDETMIPDWLNLNNSKLHIVFHKDYIPKEFLPTFSSSVIEMFINKIPDLAENFIYSCDDMLFIKPISENYFFENNRPVSPLKIVSNTFIPIHEEWCYIENNNIKLTEKLLGKKYNCNHPHFQIALNKSFIDFIWTKLKDDFIKGLSVSKFRNRYENQIWIFDDLQRLTGHAIINKNIFNNAKYIALSNGNFESFNGKNIICFNDVDSQNNYLEVKEKFIQYMEKILPNKSGFEK